MRLAQVKKALAAAGAAITVTIAALQDNTLSTNEAVEIAVAWGAVVLVFGFKNAPWKGENTDG